MVWLVLIVLLDLIAGYLLLPQSHKEITRLHNLNPYYNHGFNKNVASKENHYTLYTNSLGMVDARIRTVPLTNPQKRRILFIGDSFVEGVGYPYTQTFCGYLTNMVDTHKTEILNAGVSSFSPRLSYLRLKNLLEEEQLQVNDIYCFVDYSDLADELLYEDFKPQEATFFSNTIYAIKVFYRKNSVIYNVSTFIKQQAFLTKNNIPPTFGFLYWVKSNNNFLKNCKDYFVIRNSWHLLLTEDACTAKGANLLEKSMADIQLLCQKHQIKVHFVVYPPRGVFDFDSYEINLINTFYKNIFAQNQLSYLNLYEEMIQNTPAENMKIKEAYYIPNDPQWNDKGHQFVAQYLYRHLMLKP